MRKFLNKQIFFFIFSLICLQSAQAQHSKGVIALNQNVTPFTKNKIVLDALPASSNDTFELFAKDRQLPIIKDVFAEPTIKMFVVYN